MHACPGSRRALCATALALAAGACASAANAQTDIWSGSGSWFGPAHWSLGFPPSPTMPAFMADGSALICPGPSASALELVAGSTVFFPYGGSAPGSMTITVA